MRIVSLVPSLTELIAELGRIGDLVGRTRYCVEPAGRIESVEELGGTKNPDLDRIEELRPDLVVMSAEENRREDYLRLQSAGLQVFVVHPRTVAGAARMIDELGRRIGAGRAARDLSRRCVEAAGGAPAEPLGVFCPIWRAPWMTFGGRTYVADVLRTCGYRSVFDDEDRDFFEVSLEQVALRRPHAVLLPDEPYRFSLEHRTELREAGIDVPAVLIDGRDLSWYGPRIPRALARLRALRRELARSSD
ncbi:MAG: cobalamin-binding protein [Deltaproteobacteria bacterium]|nr:MAG: cobalamin-binding protein [Deltaproteobacteria bacterium]